MGPWVRLCIWGWVNGGAGAIESAVILRKLHKSMKETLLCFWQHLWIRACGMCHCLLLRDVYSLAVKCLLFWTFWTSPSVSLRTLCWPSLCVTHQTQRHSADTSSSLASVFWILCPFLCLQSRISKPFSKPSYAFWPQTFMLHICCSVSHFLMFMFLVCFVIDSFIVFCASAHWARLYMEIWTEQIQSLLF